MSVHVEDRKSVSLLTLQDMRARGERIAMLTCYDHCFARLLDEAGVDMLLVGDSLGMVLQGHASTLPVTLADMVYHTRAVASARPKAMVVADMPFASYQSSPAQAFESAAALMAAGAQMVKIEGGAWLVPTVEFVRARGIPVCAHLGLTPQSVHALGGYRVQGRGEAGERLIEEALALQNAGADVVLVELIPSPLGQRLSAALTVPTIGIGAGPHTSGQVLVLHDMLDLTPGKKARFVKNYLQQGGSVQAALRAYVEEVKSGAYPQPQHGFAD
ncbi:MAG: 3-methyl-2-oxobutanoate hydroxymethyltransferase [Betaproteobacteria bacterium]|jgi:3-methyl-2-oxobutanoate hydroxymethyltransferase|nr:3-methyl-2-oxobutanoate hydroxymethyltransferase [Betaproteobacteria bacterium]